MQVKKQMDDLVEKFREEFISTDWTALDSTLNNEARAEWNSIYASLRSYSQMQGRVIGIEQIDIGQENVEEETHAEGASENHGLLCLTVTPYRVKIIIPEPLIWFPGEDRSSFVLQSMVGAQIEFVIIAIDRRNGFAVGSRIEALNHLRWLAHSVDKIKVGDLVPCQVLAVGPTKVTVTACGYDRTLRASEMSYSYLGDLRDCYGPGQTLQARVLAIDENHFTISVKAAESDPFIGAEFRHPIGAIRLATVISKYKGGIFCRLPDGCTAICRYARQFTDDQFHINDTVSIQITSYSSDREWLRGKIRGKIG